MLRIAALVTCLVLRGANAQELSNVEEAKKAAFDAESQGIWKQIKWQSNSDAAIKQAMEQSKPLMVFLFVGKWGQQNATEC